MPDQNRIITVQRGASSLSDQDGNVLTPPADWELLPPGDATLTRRVKKAGFHWLVQEKKGRRTFSKGVWAPTATILAEKEKVEAERETPEYTKKLQASRQRRADQQKQYVGDFNQQVLAYLNFHPDHFILAERLAEQVTSHATPVGCGTVARTKRLTIEKKVEAAVIAWMRHRTTAYDSMTIARVKGRRRQVRRELAQKSLELLEKYRHPCISEDKSCPLYRALSTK